MVFGHIRSDNGPEFVAKAVQQWITAVGAKAAYIEPGSPWETMTSRALRACAMNCSMVKSSIPCARPRSSSKVGGATSIQFGRMNHSATNRQAPEVFVPAFAAWPAALRRPAPPATLPLRNGQR
jgi:putative transposase